MISLLTIFFELTALDNQCDTSRGDCKLYFLFDATMPFNSLRINIGNEEFNTHIEHRKRLLLSFYHSLLSISQN